MICAVTLKDLNKIHQINRDELGYDYPLDKSLNQLRIRKILNDPNHHFLALYQNDFDHKILGYVHAEIYEEIYADPSLNVLALAVSSDSQKSGIGTQLMGWLEDQALKNGLTNIRLNSGMSRTAAHNFYEHIGYKHMADCKNHPNTACF
ncbi:GNAT family N-acetyltransferase [Leuconostoc citreum]|uniref:GNAT family N-acetyltransferase n=1 Tax=Leuconostoc citreum TaxID=33964 RepID=UPI0011BB42C2|nr:GNAT family N-acetyltransferase [Leuconostoc citreum]QEA36900.1 GNAT family N-acetyltransferase [Leuconostoc citreum]